VNLIAKTLTKSKGSTDMSFFERLEQRCKEVDSILCVGLDPHRQDLETLGDVSAEGAFTFAINLIDQTKHIAVAYKPNAAFFEALGAEGVNALARGTCIVLVVGLLFGSCCCGFFFLELKI
jgi:orotidine-5'-phosphate decarboxylase